MADYAVLIRPICYLLHLPEWSFPSDPVVGWVERSETHHFFLCRWWVSLLRAFSAAGVSSLIEYRIFVKHIPPDLMKQAIRYPCASRDFPTPTRFVPAFRSCGGSPRPVARTVRSWSFRTLRAPACRSGARPRTTPQSAR